MRIRLEDVKPRLNMTGNGNDRELTDLIDAAEAVYRRLIGPLEPTVFTERHVGPSAVLRYRPVVRIDAVTDGAGTPLTGFFVSLEPGVIYGLRAPATITYTAGLVAVPPDVRELIAADVAGYFSATQRGGGALRPNFPGEGFVPEQTISPLVMWPRIEAAAGKRGGSIA